MIVQRLVLAAIACSAIVSGCAPALDSVPGNLPFGSVCSDASECSSGICAAGNVGAPRCSSDCSSDCACPTGYECSATVGGGSICFPGTNTCNTRDLGVAPDLGTCTPQCGTRVCGDDGCGGSCGTCSVGTSCMSGVCTASCTESCAYSNDGACDDGGEGAAYDVCDLGTDCLDCGPRGACTPACSGRACGSDSCGGSCGTCTSGSCSALGTCVASCTPSCSGLECGNDGCGGTCGTCTGYRACSGGTCVDDCSSAGNGAVCTAAIDVAIEGGPTYQANYTSNPFSPNYSGNSVTAITTRLSPAFWRITDCNATSFSDNGVVPKMVGAMGLECNSTLGTQRTEYPALPQNSLIVIPQGSEVPFAYRQTFSHRAPGDYTEMTLTSFGCDPGDVVSGLVMARLTSEDGGHHMTASSSFSFVLYDQGAGVQSDPCDE